MKGSGIKYITLTMLMLLLQAAILLLSSGRINNPRYLYFISINMCYTILAILYLHKKKPELINDRGEKKEGIKNWDQYLVASHNLLLIFVLPFIIGLDYRFNGFCFNNYSLIPGFVLYALSNFFVLRAMIVNRYFETNIRIQSEKAHIVINRFPYSFVRHPGYLGAILWSMAAPLILGSIIGFIPSCIAIIIMVVRTFLEDKTLINELPGYKLYTGQTKYRLCPKLF